MLRGLFVTGTDTGVGKTVAAAALVRRYRGRFPLTYWKPIQTGIEQDDDTAEVVRLAACDGREILDAGVRLERPLSPHLSARLAGRPIDVDALVAMARDANGENRWIVEGAGGVLVPIGDDGNMADLIGRLALPAIVVARTTLGTINHTLLTLEALGRRSVHVAGVIMVGVPNDDNREAIERFGGVHVLGVMPRFDSLSAEVLSRWSAAELDREERLSALLQ